MFVDEEPTCGLCDEPYPGETYQEHREHCAGDPSEINHDTVREQTGDDA